MLDKYKHHLIFALKKSIEIICDIMVWTVTVKRFKVRERYVALYQQYITKTKASG